MSTYLKVGQVVPVLAYLIFLTGVVILPAKALEPIQGQAILRIMGNIADANAGGQVEFDLHRLESLGATQFITMTPWYDKPITFEGVLLRKILEVVGAKGKEILVTALNDYRSILPMEDFTKYDVILAYKRDGKYMRIRDKGPLFIVYPFDSDPELQRQMYYGRSVWQVTQIVVQ